MVLIPEWWVSFPARDGVLQHVNTPHFLHSLAITVSAITVSSPACVLQTSSKLRLRFGTFGSVFRSQNLWSKTRWQDEAPWDQPFGLSNTEAVETGTVCTGTVRSRQPMSITKDIACDIHYLIPMSHEVDNGKTRLVQILRKSTWVVLQLEANFADIADITLISPDILRFREYKILSHE